MGRGRRGNVVRFQPACMEEKREEEEVLGLLIKEGALTDQVTESSNRLQPVVWTR